MGIEAVNTYFRNFKRAWQVMRQATPVNAGQALCANRGWEYTPAVAELLDRAGMVYVPRGDGCIEILRGFAPQLGLFAGNMFLGEGRWAFPIRSLSGGILALVGWFPDERRYITTKSAFFEKGLCFFGMEEIGLDREGFLVEGIFDALAIRSLGYRAVAAMGAGVSRFKARLLYSLWDRVVAIPDCDETGSQTVIADKWHLPANGSYLTWSGGYRLDDDGHESKIKDIDLLVKLYQPQSVCELFDEALRTRNRRILRYEL